MTAGAVPRIGERASWERVFAALDSRGLVTRVRGDSHADARCPAHEDGRASLTADYRPGDPGRVLLCCHAGCEFGAIVAALGLAEADTFDGPPQQDRPRASRPRPSRAARPPSAESPGRAKCARCRWREVEAYRYTDRGEVVLEVVRQVCQVCGRKNFPVRSPDGRGGWAWKWPEHRPLYRLDQVREAVEQGRTVYVVEGEKDVHAAERAGEVATTNPGGAGKWSMAHTRALMGAARVVIVCDRDPVDAKSGYRPGYRHAAAVAGSIKGVVNELIVVEPATGKDLSDHLTAGRTLAELAEVPAARLAELAARAAPQSAQVTELDAHRGGTGSRKPPGDDDDQGEDDDGGEPDPPIGAELVDGSPGWAYLPPRDGYPGEVLKLTGTGKRRGWIVVVPWAPDVLARLVTAGDDGQATGRHFELKIGDDTAIVSNADLRSGEAWDKYPDATGLGAKPVREVMHNVVTGDARKKPRTLAATRTGWHGSDGQRCYVWPDGRTFPDGRKIRLIGMRPELAEAARPRGEATDAELRQALADIGKHGRHGGMLGLGAGARSFGQSIRPVPAGLAPWGDPASGKSSLGWHARSLAITSKGGRVPGWPPLPTRSFSATRTVLELAANAEADVPTLFEDLALPADAAAVEVREANGKIEALIRSVANADEIRGRATRDLVPAPANYVRSIPLLTAERMPPVMMASLYRRAIVPRLYPGQIDLAWYAAHSAELLTPLRTIGARVVRLLYDLGADAADQLDKYTVAALGELSSAIGDAAWVRDVPSMAGVIDASAAILGGLYLVAEVVPGADPAELTAPAVTYLTEALAEQADVIADRGTHSGSLADSVGQVLTRALLARRAHICDKDGRPAPLVPGLAPSEQGLRDVGVAGMAWEGQGVPLYWLAERGGLGVRSEALHALLAESRDPRAAGLTPRSLPEALLRDGASLPNTTQRTRVATHHVRVANETPWLILLRPELVAGEGEPRQISLSRSSNSNEHNEHNEHSAGQGHGIEPPEPETDKERAQAGQGHDEPGAEPALAEPVKPLTSAVPVVLDVPAGSGTAPGFVTGSDRFAAAALVADVDGGYLARPDQVEARQLPSPLRNLADAVGWACTLNLGVGRDRDPVLVILPEMAAALGLPASPPARPSDRGAPKAAREHPALAPLRDSGWNVDALRSWMRAWRPGGRTVRIWLPGWDEYGTCPMWGDGGVPAVALAYRLGLFAELVGLGWRFTGGVTGIDLAGTFPRRRMRLAEADPPPPAKVAAIEPDFHWSRKPLSDEAAAGWLHCYDANAMYLTAYGQAVVNLGGSHQVEAPEFDSKVPGYWLLDELPEPGDRLLPDMANPTGRDTGGRPGGWLMTATLARMAELGCEIRPRAAWLPDGDYGRWYEPFYERLRDARAALSASADPDSAAVLDAVKLVWHQTHGMFTAKSQGAQFHPDHRHVVMATAKAGLHRRLGKIADAERRWPLAVATDNVAYASADPDPVRACPAGLRLGAGLGEFKVAGTLPMADAVPLLGTGRGADVTRLFDAAAEWREAHDGA